MKAILFGSIGTLVETSEIQRKTSVNFAMLLKIVAKSFPKTRIRFTTSNPQDIDTEELETMASYDNICNHIHLPVQSGSDQILKKMNTDIIFYLCSLSN